MMPDHSHLPATIHEVVPDPLVPPDPLLFETVPTIPAGQFVAPLQAQAQQQPISQQMPDPMPQQMPEPMPQQMPDPMPQQMPEPISQPPVMPPPMPHTMAAPIATQLQVLSARLMHLQTTVELELPPGLPVIHIGKPNDRIPPDIDVSGFPDSEIVSRIHADIRVEGDAYYIEDVGSANGTYINNVPLPMGNRHRLRSGDRVALGKGDKVTFLFQQS
jgi:pSer/pThr/pTyr-binding forkhead associated (FHA) protein